MRARTLLVNVSKVAGKMALGFSVLAFSVQMSHAQGSVDIGTGEGAPGTNAPVEVTLAGTGDQTIVAVTNDIGFPADSPIASTGTGTPDCTLNPAIMKGNTSYAFRPRDCTPGTDCTGMRATVISFNPAESDTDIPDGLLYTCNVAVPAGAAIPSTIALENQVAGITNVDREDIDVTEASADGSVEVIEQPVDTATPTATATAVGPTATNTAPPATATNTRGPGGGGEDDDGCHMTASADATSGWLLLVPAALLIWRRRRTL